MRNRTEYQTTYDAGSDGAPNVVPSAVCLSLRRDERRRHRERHGSDEGRHLLTDHQSVPPYVPDQPLGCLTVPGIPASKSSSCVPRGRSRVALQCASSEDARLEIAKKLHPTFNDRIGLHTNVRFIVP